MALLLAVHPASPQLGEPSHYIKSSYKLPAPILTEGQAFLLEPGVEAVKVIDVKGREVPARKTAYKLLRFIRTTAPRQHEMWLEGYMQPVTVETQEHLLNHPRLNPVVQDEPLERLIKNYPRGVAWSYGATILADSPTGGQQTFDTEFRPVKIKRALRLWRPESLYLAAYGAGGFGGNLDSFLWTAEHPVRVFLNPTHLKPIEGVEMIEGDVTEAEAEREIKRRQDPRTYSVFSVHAADQWHLSRLLSPYPPSKDFAHASSRVRRALRAGKLVPGMTYRQVAWIIGWPNVVGTPEDIERMKLSAWEYPSPVFSDNAIFKNGKFVSYDVYNLP